MGICQDRVVVITGAGRGLGRSHALAFAREGAKVVVNDVGGDVHGQGSDEGPAAQVAAEIEELGGKALVNTDSVADPESVDRLICQAIDEFGRLDVLVNNAGILRDRVLFKMTPDEWDAVLNVHLRGTFLVTARAAQYWREQEKAGTPLEANVVNTTSGAGLFGHAGQANYAAAKAGIAALTIVSSLELARYGVVVNAIAPIARTRMTTGLVQEAEASEPDPLDVSHVSPLVVWLGSTDARWLSGQVLRIRGGRIERMQTWAAAAAAEIPFDIGAAQIGQVVRSNLYGAVATGARG